MCGKVIGYQVGTTDAFNAGTDDINEHYVDGVSLTHGNPRQHIWTFAAAHGETNRCTICNCPCTNNASQQVNHRNFQNLWRTTSSVIRAVQRVLEGYSMVTTLCGMVLVAGL